MTELSRQPVADRAEHNAFFPSEYSLSQYTAPKTNFAGTKFAQPYTGGKFKVLMVVTDERYLQMQNGKFFSTGNHPVETLLPMLHIHKAGFEIDVATLSGNHAKFEMWAMPNEDAAIAEIYAEYLPKLDKPAKLADILDAVTAPDSPYLAVLIPGAHGAFNKLPESREMQRLLDWALANDKFVITLCHGPAALAAAAVGRADADFPFTFKGYELCVFPDALDEGANLDIGYYYARQTALAAGKTLRRAGHGEKQQNRHRRQRAQRPPPAHRQQPFGGQRAGHFGGGRIA